MRAEAVILPKSIQQNIISAHLPITLVMCCLIGLGLRLFGLTTESLWLDEATSLNIARMPLPDLGVYLLKEDVHPPLYFMLLHFWVMGGESVAYLRLFSVIAGVLTIPAIYLLGKQLFEQNVGLIAAVLMAISPLHIYYSQMVRMYVLFVLFTVLAFYCLLRAVESDNWRWWSLYIFSGLASLFTHYFAIFALFFHSLLVLLFMYIGRRSVREWRYPALAWGVIGVLTLLWLINSAVFSGEESPGWLAREGAPAFTQITSTISAFSLGNTTEGYPRWLRLGSYIFFFGLVVAASFGLNRGQPFARLRHQGVQISLGYLFLPLLTVWLVSQLKQIYVLRYVSPFMVPYFLLLAAGLGELKAHWQRGLGLSLTTLIMLPGVWFTYQTLQSEDWRIASAYILERAQPNDVIIFNPPWYEKPFDYYAKEQIARFSDLWPDSFVPEQICQQTFSDYHRLWLVQLQDKPSTDPQNRLQSCFGNRFNLIDMSQFPPNNGKILLYSLPNSE